MLKKLRRSRWLFWRRFASNRGAVLGLVTVAIITIIAVLAGFLAPHDPSKLGARPFLPPGTASYTLGTDDLGRDVLSGVIYGAGPSLTVGLVAALMSFLIGTTIGAISGYRGGRLGDLLDRTTEFFMVIPQFFLALLLVAYFGSGLGKVIFVIAFLSWPPIARLIRSQFLSLKQYEFVDAARSLGMSPLRIIVGEVMINALPPAIVAGSLQVGRAILLEASLSFLGLGDPEVITWGAMLHDAQPFLRQAPWLTIFPGMAISIVVLAFNLIGDGLNDAMNPRSQQR